MLGKEPQLDLGYVRMRFGADLSELDRGFASAKKKQQNFVRDANRASTVEFAANTRPVDSAIGSVKQSLRSLAGQTATIEVESKGAGTTRQALEAVNDKADQLDGRKVSMAVGAVGAIGARAALIRAGESMDLLSRTTSALRAQMMPLGFAAFPAVAGAATSMTAALGSLGVSLGQGAVGFGLIGGAAAAAAAGGLAAYRAVISRVVADSREAYFAINQNAEAHLAEQRAQILNTNASVRFNEALNQTILRLTGVEAAIGRRVLPAMTRWLATGRQLIPQLTPPLMDLVDSVTESADGFVRMASSAQNVARIRGILDFVALAGSRAAAQIANLGQVGLRLAPMLIRPAETLLNRANGLANAFHDWAMSARGVSTISSVVGVLETRMNQLLSIASNAGRGLVNIFSALNQSGVGGALLGDIVGLSRAFANVGAQGTKSRQIIIQFAQQGGAFIRQLAGLAHHTGAQFFRVAQAAMKVRMEGSKVSVLTATFNALRDSIKPVADMMIDAFTKLGPQIPALIRNLSGLLNVFGGQTPVLRLYLQNMNMLLSAFNRLPAPVKNAAANMVAMSSILKTTSGVSIPGMVGGLAGLVFHMRLLSAANQMAGRQSLIAAASMKAQTAAMYGWAAATKVAAVGSRVLGVALRFMLGPWGLVATAAVTAAVLIWKNWGPISQKLIAAWNAIKRVAVVAWNAVKNVVVSAVRSTVANVVAGWNNAKRNTQMVWNGIKGTITAASNAIKGVVQKGITLARNVITAGWNAVKRVTASVWNGIKSMLSAVWNFLRGRIQQSWSFYKNTISAGWNAIRSVTSSVWNAIKSFLIALWNNLRSTASRWMSGLKSLISAGWNAIKGATSSAWEAIKTAIVSKFTAAKSTATTLLNGLRDTALGVWNTLKSKVGPIFSAIGKSITSPISAAKNTLQGIWNSILSGIAKVLSAVGLGGLADKVEGAKWAKGGTTEDTPSPRLAFAKGGVGTRSRKPQVHLWNEQYGNEAYIVENRPTREQLPYLATAARWHGFGLVPMEKGGTSGAGGYSRGEAIPVRVVNLAAGGTFGVSGARGRKYHGQGPAVDVYARPGTAVRAPAPGRATGIASQGFGSSWVKGYMGDLGFIAAHIAPKVGRGGFGRGATLGTILNWPIHPEHAHVHWAAAQGHVPPPANVGIGRAWSRWTSGGRGRPPRGATVFEDGSWRKGSQSGCIPGRACDDRHRGGGGGGGYARPPRGATVFEDGSWRARNGRSGCIPGRPCDDRRPSRNARGQRERPRPHISGRGLPNARAIKARANRRVAAELRGRGFALGGTTYNWVPWVRDIVKDIERHNEPSAPNTYRGHPGGEGYSADYWSQNGRGSPIAPSVGDAIERYTLSKYRDKLRYYIWRGMIHDAGGSRRYTDPNDQHFDHYHGTFGGAGAGGLFTSLWDTVGEALWNRLVQRPYDAATSGWGSGMVLRAGAKAAGQNVLDGIKDWIISKAGASGGEGMPGWQGGSPAQNRQLGSKMAAERGWSGGQFSSLDSLWQAESGWDRFADNPTSAAYGIPQANPGSKMGADAVPPKSWAGPQIKWGLGYIKSRYGDPAGAWGHHRQHGWYEKGGRIPGRPGEPKVIGAHAGEVVLPRGVSDAFLKHADALRTSVREHRRGERYDTFLGRGGFAGRAGGGLAAGPLASARRDGEVVRELRQLVRAVREEHHTDRQEDVRRLEHLRHTVIKAIATLPRSELFHDAIDEAFASAIREESAKMGDVK